MYVQPFLESLCEFRVFIVGGKIVHDYFAGYKKTMPDGTFADFAAMSDNDVDEALQAKQSQLLATISDRKGTSLHLNGLHICSAGSPIYLPCALTF